VEYLLGSMVFVIMVILALQGISMNPRGRKVLRFLGIVAIVLFLVQNILQCEKSNLQEKKMDKLVDDLAKTRELISQQISKGSAPVESATIDRVYPFLRYAFQLENYDGSANKAGNEDRIILESSPPVRLHYSKGRAFWFDFGVANLNYKAPIDNIMFSVTFLDEGLTVTPEGHWGKSLDNQNFLFHFQSINAQAGLNGDGGLSVIFPRPGKYTIQLVINAKGLGQKKRDLPVSRL